MQYKTSILLIGLAALSSSAVLAQEFDNNDVPQQCRSVCQAMVDAARTCDNNFDGDRQEVDCICNTEGASTQLPECAACVRQFDTDIDEDDRDEQNDVDEVMSSCGFTSTTFNAAAAGSSSSSSGGTMTSSSSGSLITSTYTTTSTDIDNDPDDQDETETLTRTTIFPADATPTDAAGSATQSAGSVTSSAGGSAEAATSNANAGADSATSGAGASATGGDDASGAAATALPMLGAGAGALVAVFGLL